MRASPPLLAVATGPYIGEGFDCPALDTLSLAAPIVFKGRLVWYAGRILRPYPGKATAEIHDYHYLPKGVLAASLAKRPHLHQPRLPDPRRSPTQAPAKPERSASLRSDSASASRIPAEEA
jgi:superfamily II DNA or RNA helicase